MDGLPKLDYHRLSGDEAAHAQRGESFSAGGRDRGRRRVARKPVIRVGRGGSRMAIDALVAVRAPIGAGMAVGGRRAAARMAVGLS
jgi:hypothetical protein